MFVLTLCEKEMVRHNKCFSYYNRRRVCVKIICGRIKAKIKKAQLLFHGSLHSYIMGNVALTIERKLL